MFCPNCGTKNDDDAVFCGNCGTRIMGDNPAPSGQMAGNVTPPPVENGNGMGMQNMQQNPPKPFKLSKKLIAVIGAAAAVVIVLVVLFNVGKSVTDYKKVATKYVKAVEEADWDKAFSLMNLPEGEFLTKEGFIKAKSDESGVKITEIKAKDVSELKDLLDDEQSLGTKSVAVTYAYPGSSTNVEYVTLDKLGTKFLFFFSQYKVSADGVVAFDSIIKVPAGSKLYINEVEVAASYKSENKSTEKQDYYVIPYLFQGDNVVKVQSQFAEDMEETVNFYGEGDSYSVSASSMNYKNEMLEAAKTQAKSDLEKLIAAAVEQKEFSSIGIVSLPSAETTLKNYYTKNLVGDCHSSYKDITSLSLSSCTVKANQTSVSVDSTDGLPYIKVGVDYALTGTYAYKSNGEAKEGKNNSSSAAFTYKYSDGQWRLYKISMSLYIS